MTPREPSRIKGHANGRLIDDYVACVDSDGYRICSVDEPDCKYYRYENDKLYTNHGGGMTITFTPSDDKSDSKEIKKCCWHRFRAPYLYDLYDGT